MPLGYWILVACIVAMVVIQIVRERRAAREIKALRAANERMKVGFREHETELRRYKDMCRDLLESVEKLRNLLMKCVPQKKDEKQELVAEERLADEAHAAEHLQFENRNLAYREGLLHKDQFSDDTLVHDLRKKALDCDVEASLLCFDSGICMTFSCEKEEGEPVLRVILRVPEGGSCCIYEDGKSDPAEDWPPVRACLDTMFARGREVYLSYEFRHAEEEDASA